MAYSLEHYSELINDAIRDIKYPDVAEDLFKPIKYTLESGGKRLRPMLVLAVYEALSHRPATDAINQAVAIELFHNFTLLHDDVMDKADLRRGRPTVHTRWGDNAAILSGDAMLTMASMYLAECPSDKLADLNRCFNETAMLVYEGQQLDMDFERRQQVPEHEYMEMIRLKTSVLLAGACRLGAIMAGASEDVCNAFYAYGEKLGLAFQMRDDWLDTFGDPVVFGKEIGGDIRNRKKTWLLITAINEAPEEVPAILEEDLEDLELISQIRNVYLRLKLDAKCDKVARSYSLEAIEQLSKVEIDNDALIFFKNLALEASARTH